MSTAPLVLSFAGVDPVFGSGLRGSGEGAGVLGRVRAGTNLLLGPLAVVRADGHAVTLGDDVCLGEGATVHIAHDLHPAVIGDRVAVGRNAVVHACTAGDDCVVEDDAVILDGSEVGCGAVIEADAIVYPRSRLEARGRYAGSPAKLIGTLCDEERRNRGAAIRLAAEQAASRPFAWTARVPAPPGAHFVAATAWLAGQVALAPGASVFFGCRLRAASLVVGENTNVQDNCVIETGGEVTIGRETTLGHNVRMASGRVGDRSLVGIGAVLAEGTVVEDDVLVAAGTRTTAGQVLDGGWLWGGRPAKPLKRLDAARRAMMADTVRHYVAYAQAFREAQIEAARRRGAGG